MRQALWCQSAKVNNCDNWLGGAPPPTPSEVRRGDSMGFVREISLTVLVRSSEEDLISIWPQPKVCDIC